MAEKTKEKLSVKKAPAKAKESKPEKKISVKGLYHYIREAWKKPDAKTLRERMIGWRASEVIVKVDKPLRIDRARALGYKAKKGLWLQELESNVEVTKDQDQTKVVVPRDSTLVKT